MDALDAGFISREEKKSGVKVAGRNKRARGLTAFYYISEDVSETASRHPVFCKWHTIRGLTLEADASI